MLTNKTIAPGGLFGVVRCECSLSTPVTPLLWNLRCALENITRKTRTSISLTREGGGETRGMDFGGNFQVGSTPGRQIQIVVNFLEPWLGFRSEAEFDSNV